MSEKLWDKSDFARAMQGQKHTPEPWHRNAISDGAASEWEVFAGGGDRVTPIGRIYERGDAKRVLACVNACKGIPLTALEAGVVGKLVSALRECYQALELAWQYDGDLWGSDHNRIVDVSQDAENLLAKLENSAAQPSGYGSDGE